MLKIFPTLFLLFFLYIIVIDTITPNHLSQGSWEERKEEMADKLIKFTEKYFADLDKHIVVRKIFPPSEWRKLTHTNHHAFGGLASMVGKKGLTAKTPIEGLWFVGAQAEAGGGMNNVVPFAFKTAKKIHKENK